MPTYFFDLIKGSDLVEDDQGEDFVDIEAAKLEGLASARELLADAAKKGILATSPVYLIRNAAGRRSGVISPTSRHDSRRHAGLQGDRKLHAHRVRDSSKNRHTCSRPCAISEIKSSIFSMPTEMRISASVSPISSRNSRATPESVIEAGREISVLAPPKLTASFMIWKLSSSANASSPPVARTPKYFPPVAALSDDKMRADWMPCERCERNHLMIRGGHSAKQRCDKGLSYQIEKGKSRTRRGL